MNITLTNALKTLADIATHDRENIDPLAALDCVIVIGDSIDGDDARALVAKAKAAASALRAADRAQMEFREVLRALPHAEPVQESEPGGLFAAAKEAGAHPLRHEARYNEYVASLRGTPAIPFDVWVRISRAAGAEDACHRAFEEYGAGRAEAGLGALAMKDFAPLWEQAVAAEIAGASLLQSLLRSAETFHGITPQAAS